MRDVVTYRGYNFWRMLGRDYVRVEDKNFACDLDSYVFQGMNNRFLISAYEGDPTSWGFQVTIYDSSDSYVIGYLCDAGFKSPTAAIDAAISTLNFYEHGTVSTSLFVPA